MKTFEAKQEGKDDKLTYPSGSEDFARLVKEAGGEVTLKLLDNLYHEVHNEPEKAKVFKLMIKWLDEHLSSKKIRSLGPCPRDKPSWGAKGRILRTH